MREDEEARVEVAAHGQDWGDYLRRVAAQEAPRRRLAHVDEVLDLARRVERRRQADRLRAVGVDAGEG